MIAFYTPNFYIFSVCHIKRPPPPAQSPLAVEWLDIALEVRILLYWPTPQTRESPSTNFGVPVDNNHFTLVKLCRRPDYLVFQLEPTVLDLVSQIRDGVLVRCIFSSGKPQGVGILECGVYGEGMGMGRSVYEQPGTEADRILSQQGGFQVSKRKQKGGKKE